LSSRWFVINYQKKHLMSPKFQIKILLFLKSPRPGLVKTRLAKDIGNQEACDIYKKLVNHTLKQLPDTSNVVINYTPKDSLPEFQNWLDSPFQYVPQSDGDLGDRMSYACNLAFEDGADAVILLGGDCPGITSNHIKKITTLLQEGKNILGPAKDGGYWTLGLTKPFPEVFQNIPWSTETVSALTRKKFQDFNRNLSQIDILEDVDNLENWNKNKFYLTQT